MKNSRIRIFTLIVTILIDRPKILSPLLKMYIEITDAKGDRIPFKSDTKRGATLFKEVSFILITYCDHISRIRMDSHGGKNLGLNIMSRDIDVLTSDKDRLYKSKYKILALIINIFTNIITGKLVAAGLYEVYGDDTLVVSIRLLLKTILDIPLEDIRSYIDKLNIIYTFFDIINRLFISIILELSNEDVGKLLIILEDGLCSFQRDVQLKSASSISSLTNFILKSSGTPGQQLDIQKHNESLMDISANDLRIKAKIFHDAHKVQFNKLQQILFHILLTGQSSPPWGLASPLFDLISLDTPFFHTIRDAFVITQNPQKRPAVIKSFNKFIASSNFQTDESHKERFCKNIAAFQKELRAMT